MELKNKQKIVLPALRGVIGDWVYYTSLMSPKTISAWIKSAKDIREAESLNEVLQRDLNDRKFQISKYLLEDPNRFFNSIIVGVYDGLPDWIEFDISKKVEEIGANHDESINESMGLLIFNGDENMFAIDGQHRVAGISIAIEEDLKKEEKGRVLKDDIFSVIFLAHIDDVLGRKRTRKLFSDINKNAKPVAKSDKIIIDEEDINAIVTRRIYAEYQYFENGKTIDISSKSNIDKIDKEHFTNIDNLYRVCTILKNLYKKKKNSVDWDEENIQTLKQVNIDFYDFIINNIKEYSDFFISKQNGLEFYRENNKYLLFRPIGIVLLARLYAYFYKKEKLDLVKLKINKINFVFPESPLNRILWNKGKMEAKSINQNFAFDLILFVLNEYDTTKIEALQERYRDLIINETAILQKRIE